MNAPRLIDLSQLSAWLRYAKITCEQTVANSFDAIAANETSGEIFTHLAQDIALENARDLDNSGGVRNQVKPLAGMPFAVQETITVNGQPKSAATALDVADLIPTQGPLIKRLRDMGATPIGKTVSTEFSFSLQNLNRPLPANPRYEAEAYTMGGSASAIAVALGLTSFALAADAAGTMRASAAMCGVTGFRPGNDFWSREGVFPLSRELDSIGLITATASDLTFMLELLGGGAAPDLSKTKLRLGVASQAFYEDLDPAIGEAMSRSLDLLAKKGAALTPIVIPEYDQLKNFNRVANGTGLVRYIGRDRLTAGFDQLDPVTQVRLRPGMEMDIAEIQRLFEMRRLLANRVNSNLAHIDALIMPTLTGMAVPAASMADADTIAEWQNGLTRNTNFAGLFNMAAITIPVPGQVSKGAPIGLQLVCPAGSEIRLTAVARAIEQTLNG